MATTVASVNARVDTLVEQRLARVESAVAERAAEAVDRVLQHRLGKLEDEIVRRLSKQQSFSSTMPPSSSYSVGSAASRATAHSAAHSSILGGESTVAGGDEENLATGDGTSGRRPAPRRQPPAAPR